MPQDTSLFRSIQLHVKDLERQLEDLRAALVHLVNHVVSLACDDLGSRLQYDVFLPLLQAKLDRLADESRRRKAEDILGDLLRQEEVEAERRRVRACGSRACRGLPPFFDAGL